MIGHRTTNTEHFREFVFSFWSNQKLSSLLTAVKDTITGNALVNPFDRGNLWLAVLSIR